MDGKVEAVFEGPDSAVDTMGNWCRQGPSGARVSHVDVKEEKPTGEFTGFSIKGSW